MSDKTKIMLTSRLRANIKDICKPISLSPSLTVPITTGPITLLGLTIDPMRHYRARRCHFIRVDVPLNCNLRLSNLLHFADFSPIILG